MRLFITILFVALFANISFAGDPLQEAFAKSYEHEAKSDFTGAINDLRGVYSETGYEVNLRMGWLHYSAGLFTESMSYYVKAMDLMPASVEAKFGAIYPAAALGNWDQVKTYYESILNIDPKNTQALYRLGLIHYGREEFDKSMANFQVGFNLYPFDYDFMLMMAWTNLKMGKIREAKVLFNKVMLVSPADESATEGLGLIK